MKARKILVLVVLVAIGVATVAMAASASGIPAPKVLARGARIHGANGIYFGADDNLYIASVWGQEIVVMNPRNGKILRRLGGDAGVKAPDDVTIGPDGSIYWTAITAGEVGKIAPDGTLSTQPLAPGVNPITVSDDGRLFVALDFMGDGLYELDPNLVNPPRGIIVSSPANPYPLGFLNGFDFGPDGRLYGPIWSAGMVVSIDVDSCEGTSDPWNDCDIRPVTTGLEVPAAVKFDSKGRLHVGDNLTGEIFRVDIATGERTLVGKLAQGLDNLAFDSRDRLYASQAIDGSIARVLRNGRPRYISRNGMIVPGGVAVLPRGPKSESVFVADLFSIREFDGRTGRQLSVSKSVMAKSAMTNPSTVSADGDNLIFSAWVGNKVQVWNPAAQKVLEDHTVHVPLNAIRFQGELIAASLAAPPGHVTWLSGGAPIIGPPTVIMPTGLAADEDTLWVSGFLSGNVVQFEFEGKTVVDTQVIASGLASPEGLALDQDGTLLVVESGAGRLTRIDPATGATSTVAEGLAIGLAGSPPTYVMNGVAVGPSGDIYVTGDVNNVLYRIRR